MEKKTTFLEHPMVTAIIGTLVGTLIGSLIAASVTATNVEKSTVELMSKRLEIVEENDTLEEAINKVNKDVEEKDATISEQTRQIAELTNQLNDDTEMKKLNGELEAKQTEIDTLQENMNSLQKEKDKLQEEKDELQKDYNELEQKKYEEYILSKQSSTPISIRSIDVLKNERMDTGNSGDVSVNGTSVSYYLDAENNDAYIEYKLDMNFSEFKGSVYISKSAYENYDSDAAAITSASVSIEVKYADSDIYQEIANKSGLSADSDPVEIRESIIGATRLRISIKGGQGPWGSIIRLGDPVLYRVLSK